MQPVKFLKFLRQFVVLVERNLQLIWNDKLLLASLTLQSPFMVLVVKLTADPNCFTSNLVNIGSRTALFILAAMATFMGTLNSYREICREREIILREASVGVSLPAVVLSKAAVLLLVEVLQAAILALGFVSIVHVPQNHLLLETDMEIFITVLLTMFSSSCIGLLISALFTSGESAILAVLVLMIGQVVFSNIMFTVTGAAATISNIIVCRWGMGALGASTDLNSRMAWLQAGLDGAKMRGENTQVGDKTMIDALEPAVLAFKEKATAGASIQEACAAATDAAKAGSDSTIDLIAKKGRASYLGERSIGHRDAGSYGIYVFAKAVAAYVAE